MKARHLLLMLLRASGGSIASKTKIQKQIYLLSVLLGEEFGFKAHYYGPFSPQVEAGLDELIGAGFVDMNEMSFATFQNQGFEYKRYDFSLTESGERFGEVLAKENPKRYKDVERFVETLRKVGNPDYLSLSIASKAYFILDRVGKPLTKVELMDRAEKFGWLVRREDIDKAYDILEDLDMIEDATA